jgi:hypothetical protein
VAKFSKPLQYNTDLPTCAELPSAIKLMQSTILAAIVALTLITVVMPSEYGIDPTGVVVYWGLSRWEKSKRSLPKKLMPIIRPALFSKDSWLRQLMSDRSRIILRQ